MSGTAFGITGPDTVYDEESISVLLPGSNMERRILGIAVRHDGCKYRIDLFALDGTIVGRATHDDLESAIVAASQNSRGIPEDLSGAVENWRYYNWNTVCRINDHMINAGFCSWVTPTRNPDEPFTSIKFGCRQKNVAGRLTREACERLLDEMSDGR